MLLAGRANEVAGIAGLVEADGLAAVRADSLIEAFAVFIAFVAVAVALKIVVVLVFIPVAEVFLNFAEVFIQLFNVVVERCDIAAEVESVLFVGTKKQAQEAIKEEASRVGM